MRPLLITAAWSLSVGALLWVVGRYATGYILPLGLALALGWAWLRHAQQGLTHRWVGVAAPLAIHVFALIYLCWMIVKYHEGWVEVFFVWAMAAFSASGLLFALGGLAARGLSRRQRLQVFTVSLLSATVLVGLLLIFWQAGDVVRERRYLTWLLLPVIYASAFLAATAFARLLGKAMPDGPGVPIEAALLPVGGMMAGSLPLVEFWNSCAAATLFPYMLCG